MEEIKEYDNFIIQKGESLLKNGEQPQDIFWLLNGTWGIYHNGKKVNQIMASDESSIAGELSLLLNESISADVIAEEQCRVQRIPFSIYKEDLQKTPELIKLILTWTAEVLRSKTDADYLLKAFEKNRPVPEDFKPILENYINSCMNGYQETPKLVQILFKGMSSKLKRTIKTTDKSKASNITLNLKSLATAFFIESTEKSPLLAHLLSSKELSS